VIAWLKAEFPIAWMCRQLEVSKSGYYKWVATEEKPSPTEARRNELVPFVEAKFVRSKQSAGRRKITRLLRNDGLQVNHKLVGRIMHEQGLVPHQVRRAWKKAAQRQNRVPDPADALNRVFSAPIPGTKLVGDITQVPTGQGWLYLATVIDLATREIIGHAHGPRMTAELVVRAFTAAKRGGTLPAGATFHSDHGAQYRSKRFAAYCRRNRITRSMGEKFECWDNAVAESFFAGLKNERLHAFRFDSRAEAAAEIEDYIRYYNHERPHGTLDYDTPATRRAQLTTAA
jgi:transposase InsO family protein